MSHGPLQGVRVVTCSTAQAGTVPYMLMADLGAEVIKIEVPDGGDTSRNSSVLPGLPSTYFETNNRGVKSVTLNLKTAEGQRILHRLVARAEIFGQNFRPGAAERPGLSASFNDRDGKPLVFQLNGGRQWKSAISALGFSDALERAGFADLGVIVASEEQRVTLLRTLDELFATGLRDDWVA